MKFRRSKVPKFIPIVSLLILLVLGPIVFSFLQNARGVEAAWVDDNFSYRNAIPISSHTAAENNVYVTVTLDTSASGQFQSDCGDLRFTTVGGDILPYYIVSGCVSASTVVHVFFKSMPAGAQTIYYYYGNPSAANGFSSSDFSTQAANYAVGTIGSQEKGGAPVVYWKMDEGSGTTLKDSGPSAQNLTFSGTPTWTTEDQCVSGKCINFDTDGSDLATITVATGSAINLQTSDFTISMWQKVFQPTTFGSGIIGRYPHNSSYNGNYSTGIADDLTTYFFYHRDMSGSLQAFQITYTPYFGKWTHIEWIKSGSIVYLYVDGKYKQQWNITISFNINFTSSPFQLAVTGWSPGVMNNLMMDDIKIYRYARTAAQVKTDYTSRGHTKGSSVGLGSSPKNSDALSNGLIGYWKTDEATWSGTASEVIDSSGNANHGTAQGTTGGKAYPTGGKFGNSGFFDGVDDWINVPSSAGGPLDVTSRITIATWISPTSYAGCVSAAKCDIVNKNGSYLLEMEPAGYRFVLNQNWNTSDDLRSIGGTPSTTSWTHLVATYDGIKIKLFINGVETGSSSTSSTIGSNANAVTIGNSNTTYLFPGKIDETRIYNRALSPREVRDLYNWAPGPVGYWNLDESSGNANDSSGNGFTGTNTGTSFVDGKYGKARGFNGSSDFITVSDISSKLTINTATPPTFTLGAWFKPTSGGNDLSGISLSSSASGARLFYRPATTQFCFQMKPGTGSVACTGSSSIIEGNWYHVEAVYESTTSYLYIYLNGVLKSSGAATDANLSTGNNIPYIGNAQNYFKGSIDEVKIYNYARTQKQIVEDMNAGHPVGGSPVGSQTLYWKMDEGYSSSLKDSSPQNKTGTFACFGASCTNPSWSNSGKFGKAIYFTGSGTTGAYVTASPINNPSSTGSKITLSTWINPDASQVGNGWFVRNGTGYDENYGFYLGSPTGGNYGLGLQTYTTTWAGGSTTGKYIPASTWSYITIIFSQGEWFKLYVNGQLKETVSITGLSALSTSSFNIGGHNGTTFQMFNGYLDEFKIYSDALTEDEIKLDYNRGQAMVLGTLSDTSGLTGGSVASSAASALYCLPGDTATCTPPVAEWNFEERSGQTVNDISGNGYSGTLGANSSVASDDPTWTDGILGKALKYDGTSDYVNMGDVLDMGTSNFTITAWIKTTQTASKFAVIKGPANGVGDSRYMIYVQSTGIFKADFLYWNGSANQVTVGNTVVNDGRWHYVVAVYNRSGSLSTYVDGKFDTSSSIAAYSANSIDNASPLSFSSASNFFDGSIDDVRIYNYARSAAQVAWDYNQGKPIAQWKMDECQGGSIFDASGNGNTGTITIGATGTQTAVGTCTTSGTAWYNGVTGKYNSSLKFDGTDDYMTRNMTVSASDGTVAFWVKDFATGAGPYLFRSDANIRTYVGDESASTIYFYKGNPAVALSSTPSLTASNWNHIVLKWWTTGSTQYAEAYANGKSTGTPVTFLDSSAGSYITVAGFNQSGTQNAAGQIDDVRIYNYALTASQVKSLFNGGSAIRFGPTTGSP